SWAIDAQLRPEPNNPCRMASGGPSPYSTAASGTVMAPRGGPSTDSAPPPDGNGVTGDKPLIRNLLPLEVIICSPGTMSRIPIDAQRILGDADSRPTSEKHRRPA